VDIEKDAWKDKISNDVLDGVIGSRSLLQGLWTKHILRQDDLALMVLEGSVRGRTPIKNKNSTA